MTGGLILYVGFAQPDEWRHWAATYAAHASRFEEASGLPCLVMPFELASLERIQALSPCAVVLSGFARSFQDYDLRTLLPVCNWLRQDDRTPALAICGSHQLAGFLFNGEIEHAERLTDQPMRRLKDGEPIVNPEYHAEYFMEKAFYPLALTEPGRADPLFTECSSPPIVYESHYCEIKRLPPDFELLASTPECRVQAMRHRKRPLYGVQFHPEDYCESFTDGKRILHNFFSIARK